MKIGYKIIIGSFLLSSVFYPGNMALDKYKEFKKNQTEETTKLLTSFKTRPEDFYNNPTYEAGIKSYKEKNIRNFEIDLTAPDEPLKVDQSTSSSMVIDSVDNTSNSSVDLAKETVKPKEVPQVQNTPTPKPVAKEIEKKEPEKKIIIEGTKVQDKKVDNLEYYVQLGVFNSLDNANNLLRKAGGNFLLVKSPVNENQYIVRSNPGTKEEMERLKKLVIERDSSITPMIRVW